jgi:hypothetical protein
MKTQPAPVRSEHGQAGQRQAFGGWVAQQAYMPQWLKFFFLLLALLLIASVALGWWMHGSH